MPELEHSRTGDRQTKALEIQSFMGGLNVDVRAGAIEEGELLEALNVRFDEMRVVRDSGIRRKGSAVRGDPRLSYEFRKKSGAVEQILITNDTVYKWDVSASEWHYVSDGTDTTVNAVEATGQTAITVADITGFGDGDFVGVTLDDGSEWHTTVNGAPAAGVITITDALPSATGVGKPFVKAVDLSGSVDIPVSADTWAAVDRMYFANGVDEPQEYDGTSCHDVLNLPTSPFTCRCVAVFNNHLLLGNTTENNVPFPQRIRRSDTGDPEEWVAGTAGFEDLYDEEDHIRQLLELGPYLMVYRDQSFLRYDWAGRADLLFTATMMIPTEGVLSGASVVDIGNVHFVVGTRGVYLYNGTFELEEVTQGVFQRLFGTEAVFDMTERAKVQVVYLPQTEEVWLAYSANNEVAPRTVLRYQVKTRKWIERRFSFGITGFGFYTEVSGLTWDELAGTWDEQTGVWDDSLAAEQTFQICGDNNQVYEYSDNETMDDGASIQARIVTKDFHIPNYTVRLTGVEMLVRGTGVRLEFSRNRGVTWQELKTFSPGTVFRRVVTRQDHWIEREARFRITSQDAMFALEWMTLLYKKESILSWFSS